MNVLIYMDGIAILHFEQYMKTMEVLIYLTVPTDCDCRRGHNQSVFTNSFISLLIDRLLLLYMMFYVLVKIIQLVFRVVSV